MQGVLYLLYAGILAAAAYRDWKKKEILDHVPAAIFLLGMLDACAGGEPGMMQRLAGIAVVLLPMLGLALLLPGAFGGGDIKVMAASGWLLGWQKVLCAMALSMGAAGLYAFFLVLFYGMSVKRRIALGPFLVFGLIAAMVFGDKMISWYLSARGAAGGLLFYMPMPA